MIASIDWGQVVPVACVSTVIGLVILVVLRYALRGARDTIIREFTSNGGASMKDKVDQTNYEVQMLRREVGGMHNDLENHILYGHGRVPPRFGVPKEDT